MAVTVPLKEGAKGTKKAAKGVGKGTKKAAKGVENMVKKSKEKKDKGDSDATTSPNTSEEKEEPPKVSAPKNVQNPFKKSIWEQAALHLEKTKDSLAKAAESYGLEVQTATGVNIAVSDPTVPRGIIDLVKERATSSATSGHSGAPTPFAISIKVRGETKWKFCFSSRKKQMTWLAAITDVVVRGSVVEYNATLLEELKGVHNDSGTNERSVDRGLGGVERGETKEKNIRGKFWKMDDYDISSQRDLRGSIVGKEELKQKDRGVDGLPIVEEEKKEEKTKTDVSKQTLKIEDDDDEEEEVVDDSFSLEGVNLHVSLAFVNVMVFLARMLPSSKILFCLLFLGLNGGLRYVILEKPFVEDVEEEEEEEENDAGEEKDGSKKSKRISFMRVSLKRKRSLKKVEVPHDDDDDDGDEDNSGDSKHDKNVNDEREIETEKNKEKKKMKPIAGTTTLCVQNATDGKVHNGHKFITWRAGSGSNLMVRSYGYLSSKQKISSPTELYECVRVDVFESKRRVPNMATRVVLPKAQFKNQDVVKKWHAPDIFVISLALPTEAPSLTRPTDDGPGVTITLYLKMKEKTREVLQRITAPDYNPKTDNSEDGIDTQERLVNAVRLFDEWCRRSPTDKTFQSRFKMIPQADNPKEVGLPGWIAKYNGKPVLIRRNDVTGFLYNNPELNAMEFDITLHPFPYLAKQGLSYVKEHIFTKAIASFGFVIEGRNDDELPEVVIGCAQLCYPDPAIFIQGNDFFKGRSPQSFEE
mmetsp:Transcript_13257/g.19666  ORF Transcript_13257/g.19666 Transcript_13257/m.19666 type:complete len:755 (+) Transcript_13257:55-2319(+)